MSKKQQEQEQKAKLKLKTRLKAGLFSPAFKVRGINICMSTMV
jgi:hypothetical protein